VGRLEGDSYRLGLAAGRLGRTRIAAQEAHLHRLLAALIPGDLKRLALREAIAFQMRRLDRYIPQELLREIAGLADGYEPTRTPGGRRAWRRILDMHALHDVSQRFVDSPAIAPACTGFVAGGPATRDGHLLLARNFDFEAGHIFDREKIVWVVAPEGRIPYVSVGFAGMLGVMSGFNREGIGVAINAVSGGETAGSGLPTTLLVLQVLENDRTLEEAVDRIRRAEVFVSDLVFVAEARSGRAVIVEKTPDASAVREITPAGLLGASNTPETPEVLARTRTSPPGSTSKKRGARLHELLKTRPPLDVPAAVAILRDRQGPGGVSLGPGNRNAIDAMIAAHSVVFDLTARRAFVATAPHTLGAYVPVDLEAVLADRGGGASVSPEAPIPADPFLTSGGWDRYRAARAELMEARYLAERGAWRQALAHLSRAHDLSPGFIEATGHLAEAHARLGERAAALALLSEALSHDPAPAPFRTALEALRSALVAGAPLPAALLPTVLEPDEMLAAARAR
jgi:hypothetical protein